MYQIITDGSWDMGSERATRFGVDVVPYYVTMDGEHYLFKRDRRTGCP